MYTYETRATWTEGKTGLLKAGENPDVPVATPPEFGGPEEGFWSPEELFVGSVVTCLMSTFLFFVDKSAIGLVSYASRGTGRMDKTPTGLKFTGIDVGIQAVVESQRDFEKVERLKDRLEKACPVSATLACPVHLKIETTIREAM